MATSKIEAQGNSVKLNKHYISVQGIVDAAMPALGSGIIIGSCDSTTGAALTGLGASAILLFRRASASSQLIYYFAASGNKNGIFQGCIDAADNNAVTYKKWG